MNPDEEKAPVLSPGAGMLLGIAMGDAYGAPFENLPYLDAARRLKERGLIPGTYTDDTQQALAIAEVIVARKPFTPVTLACSFLSAYHRDPRPGYSPVTGGMLAMSNTDSFLHSISDEYRSGRKTDGAAMRALPIGFFPQRDEVIRNALISASITHGHPDALAATVAIALIAHETYYHQTPGDNLWNRIREDIQGINPDLITYGDTCSHLTTNDRDILLGAYREYGVPFTESRIFLGAVLFLLASIPHDPFRLLQESILLGGDTDTVAAVSIGTVLIRERRPNKIWSLIKDLESGQFGKTYLMNMGNRMSDRFPDPSGERKDE